MISQTDRTTLRNLASQVADIAALPIQAERRECWKAGKAPSALELVERLIAEKCKNEEGER